ncbi:sensor histidine kinase [Microbacterium sp. E-13]|uniref:sensor histidine kinase n=1 Tax=Microbacterium sp. E-13 TaxID=3404048 RepID=UPI003CF5F19D
MTMMAFRPGLAETRFLRTIAVAFGVATVVFGVLAVPSIQIQSPSMTAWWSTAALLVTFGVPLGMAIAAPWSSSRSIKRWAAWIAVSQLVVLVTWVPFMQASELPAESSQPWVFGVTAFGVTGAAMAWSGRWLWLYLPATGFLVLVDRALSSPQPFAVAFADALYAVMFGAVIAALVSVTLVRAAELDAAAASAREETAVQAARRSEHRQRSRVKALLHDQVLVTLLAAAQASSLLRGAAAAQAKNTLAKLKEYESGGASVEGRSPREFVWHLQAITTETDPGAVFSYHVAEDAHPVAAHAAQALAEGLGEALRNVVRHAELPGRELHREVHVDVATSGVRVDVLDDGRGFDPNTVPPARLGIAVSIRERMATLPGGSSDVVSLPGHGTRVVLEWAPA